MIPVRIGNRTISSMTPHFPLILTNGSKISHSNAQVSSVTPNPISYVCYDGTRTFIRRMERINNASIMGIVYDNYTMK